MNERLEWMLRRIPGYAQHCLGKKNGYLGRFGWFASFRSGMPVDGSGQPLPWMTYASIAFLATRVRAEMAVFEYGCGGSTLWWAQRVSRVIACEHDVAWFARMKARVPSNVELHHVPLDGSGNYERQARQYHDLDIIVIDGRERVVCAKVCVEALAPGGVIIWDNSDREEDREGYEFLATLSFRRIDFAGMGPVNAYPWQTSVFYRDGNCLGL